jgi:hypothetical protein
MVYTQHYTAAADLYDRIEKQKTNLKPVFARKHLGCVKFGSFAFGWHSRCWQFTAKRAKMGFKVNCFLAFCVVFGFVFSSFSVKALFANLLSFTLVYMNFKIWRFTSKFPGGGITSIARNLVNNAESFRQELSAMFAKHGDKFITWVGVERFIVVSKLSDVQVIN